MARRLATKRVGPPGRRQVAVQPAGRPRHSRHGQPARVLTQAPLAPARPAPALSPWFIARILVPFAFISFWSCAVLSVAFLPRGFDYGSCVISRLCSSYHNPQGYRFLTFGMIVMPTCLLPLTGWFPSCFRGCDQLTRWGRPMFRIGLVATSLIGVERGFFPTHWTRYENIHLLIAAVAFIFFWLGLALFAGASGPPGAPRVKWRWLYRPPWYLALCVLPLLVIFAMYAPLAIVPGAHKAVIESWPSNLVFLRTPTFWQWYLVAGLGVGVANLTCIACRCDDRTRASTGPWRRHDPHTSSRQPALDISAADLVPVRRQFLRPLALPLGWRTPVQPVRADRD